MLACSAETASSTAFLAAVRIVVWISPTDALNDDRRNSSLETSAVMPPPLKAKLIAKNRA